MPYSLVITPHAQRALKKLPADIRGVLESRLEDLKLSPRPPGCKKLQGSNEYRLRYGKYRVTYLVDDDAQSVVITGAGLREHFYG